MKKNKLDNTYTFDFDLIGIVCNQKEYKLAWHLNQALQIDLAKQEDAKIAFSDHTSILISSLIHKGPHHSVSLVQNKLSASASHKYKYLIPECSQFDYLLKIQDETKELTAENVAVRIKRIPIVEYSLRLNFDQLKSKENLLY